MKKHCLLSLLMACFLANFTTQVNAQTTLAQGDISIIGFNANSPDGFAFVNWVNLAPNTVIKFTDNGFISTSSSNTAGNYREQEQYVVWTNNTGSTIAAGTVITIQANSATAPTASVTNIGTITSVTNSSNGSTATNMSLTNTSGDQIFAFQGAGGPSTGSLSGTFSGTLLFGLNYSGSTGTSTTWVSTGSINGSTSYLPGDLSGNSQIFLGPNIVAGQYTGATTGEVSLAAYKALVANPANWTTVGTTGTVTFPTSTGITFKAGVLPLTLMSFTGKAYAAENVLYWTTANEINTAFFIIEKSTDGIFFEAIGSVDALAKGGSMQQQYQFTDTDPAAASFYRLKMADKDGAYKYSTMVHVANAGNSASAYTIFPNPVNGSVLYIKPLVNVTGKVIVSVADAAGRKWYTGKIDASLLNNGKAAIPVNSLPSGIYLLNIRNEKTGVESLLKFKK